MAQKTLNAFVVLGGRVDNTFGQIGTALINMGATVDEISRKLINFGKESIDVYRNYEDSMLDARVALSTIYGRETRELEEVMKALDSQASVWASHTIFHTDDVAEAISEAAHANWDFEKILEGIPAAMELAQAGGISLSQGLDYVIKSTNAAGIEFGDLSEFIDEWTFAANSSAGTVDEFGQAMTRMGYTMRFAGGKEELLTMLAVLHDAGTVGSEAGTLLRNTMIRLVAPTKKATDVMQELNITQGDINEAMAEVDGDTEGVVKRLGELGFSAYDSNGDLKDFLTIFKELGDATSKMKDDEERYNVWSAIFPTRTITGAMALIEAASGDWNDLYRMLVEGEAEGYGEYAAETMMSGLTGSIETFKSKVEELQRSLGAELAPQLETITDNLGKFIDVLSSGGSDNGVSAGLDIFVSLSEGVGGLADKLGEMDPAVFDAIVAGLGVLAAAGPGLIAGGLGFRFLGAALGTHTGRIALAAIAIGMLVEAVKKFEEAKFKEAFGDMDLDTAAMREKLSEIRQDFTDATTNVTELKKALDASVEAFNTASTTFSSNALTDMLTGTKLTNEDIEEYKALGSDMVKYVKDGITDSMDMGSEFWRALFNGNNGEISDEDLGVFDGLIQVLEEEKNENLADVENIGKSLEEALTKAFADGQISQEEYENIKNYFRDLNEKMVEAQREAQNEQDFIKRNKTLNKMSNMSYDSMMDFIQGDLMTQRQEELDWWEDNYMGNRYSLQYRYEKELAGANTSGKRRMVKNKYEPLLTAADTQYAQKQAEIYSEYDQMILDAMATALHESDFGDVAKSLEGHIDSILAGEISQNEAIRQVNEEYNGTYNVNQLQKYISDEVEILGGIEAVWERAQMYETAGESEMATKMNRLAKIYEMFGYVESANPYTRAEINNAIAENEETFGYEGHTPQEIWAMIQNASGYLQDYFTLAGSGAEGWQLAEYVKGLSGEQMYEIGDVLNGLGTSDAAEAYRVMTEELSPVEIEVTFPEAISAAEITHSQIETMFPPITQIVDVMLSGEGTGALGGGSMFPPIMTKKARGGRETQPAIFAEAGIPEWFIPEEHTANTAGLILGAAYNSGFDIFDLARFAGAKLFAEGGVSGGGLNWSSIPDDGSMDGSGTEGLTVNYSPVIHSDDASGVEKVLLTDKKRLEKWLREFLAKRELYESMTRYK